MTAFEYEAELADLREKLGGAQHRNAELVELLRDIQQCSLLCDSPFMWSRVDRVVNHRDYDKSGEHK